MPKVTMRKTAPAANAETKASGTGGFGKAKFNGRANTKGGSSATPLTLRDDVARIIRWNKTT